MASWWLSPCNALPFTASISSPATHEHMSSARNSPRFIKPEGSLPCPQQHTTVPHPVHTFL
jgi:hypothetical protein